jgi:hypothetical protein
VTAITHASQSITKLRLHSSAASVRFAKFTPAASYGAGIGLCSLRLGNPYNVILSIVMVSLPNHCQRNCHPELVEGSNHLKSSAAASAFTASPLWGLAAASVTSSGTTGSHFMRRSSACRFSAQLDFLQPQALLPGLSAIIWVYP